MTTATLKNKINKSLDELDTNFLQSAYFILRELANQQKYANIKVDKYVVDRKIAKGIQQLDNNEGTDFCQFLNEMQATYGKK